MANNGEPLDDSSVHSCTAALSLESSEKCCDSNSTRHPMEISDSNLATSQTGHISAEGTSSNDSLYATMKSLAEKMKCFNKTSDEADNAVDEMANILTSWNRKFIELKSDRRAVVCDHIASTAGVICNFMTFADDLLPKLGPNPHWLRCFGEIIQCFAMWSSTTPLMKWKLIEEGVVSGLIYVLEVCKDSPASEPLMFLTQLSLSVLSECLQAPNGVSYYMRTDCNKIIQCFTNSTDNDTRIYSAIILSYIERKLLENQRHHLRFISRDVQAVLDELSKSLSTDSFSSAISLLKDFQSVVMADQKNAEALISQGMLSIISNPLASSNTTVQMEAIILLWKLASIPTCMEKIKHHDDLIDTLKDLKGSSNSNLAKASSCILWDITEERNSDIDTYLEFAGGCYQFGMYKKCVDVCAEMLKTSTYHQCSTLYRFKLLKGKSLFHIFNRLIDELPAEVSPKDYYAKHKLDTCIEIAVEAVDLLGFVHDHGFIDKEGSKYLDLSMIYLISSDNALKRCERCLLCLQNLKRRTEVLDVKQQPEDKTGGSTMPSSKQSKGLQHSHVWPKAVFNAFSSGLPKTSSQRLFRLSSSTSFSQLKSPKEITWFILCKGCEQLTGNIEEQFIRKFFKKIYDTSSPSKPLEAQTIKYGNWLYQFCISIFMRGIAVLPCNDTFKRLNADKLYELFAVCRNILMPNSTQETYSAVPSIHLFVNPISPTLEESQLFSTIHENLVSPAFLAVTDKHSSKIYFRSPSESCLFVAHLGILNVVVDVRSVLTSCSHSIISEDGEYHVPCESERNLLLPQEVKKVFHAAAHQNEVNETLMPDRLRDSHWSKSSGKSPQKHHEETFMIHQAQENDRKVLLQQGVRPAVDPTNAKNMNLLPRGFNIRRLKTNSGSVELPHGHQVLLHCEVRDSDSSYDKGTTVFLAVGDGSTKYPLNKPYAIYHQYDPGMYINIGMFVSLDDLSVTGLLLDDEPKRYAQTLCDNHNFQENIQYTLMTVLYLTGFSTLKSYLPHAKNKRLHMKCLSRRRCWYCEDRCENCMEQSAFGLAEKTEGVILKFCSERCKEFFQSNPKVLDLIPATFQVAINEGKATVIPPPNHVVFQRVVDTLYDREVELNTTRIIYICFGDGSAEFPRDTTYVIYQEYTVLRQVLIAFFVSDDLSLRPLPMPPKTCDMECAKSYVDYLHSGKIVDSMLHAVLSDAGFTSFLSWRLYNLFVLGIAYFK